MFIWRCPMKKKGNDEMNGVLRPQTTDRKKKILSSFAKAVKQNDNALKKLSKN